jgi:hypothetical protein
VVPETAKQRTRPWRHHHHRHVARRSKKDVRAAHNNAHMRAAWRTHIHIKKKKPICRIRVRSLLARAPRPPPTTRPQRARTVRF